MELLLNRLICKIFTYFLFYNVVYFFNFRRFYIAVGQVSVHTRNKSSARLIIYPHA